MRLDDRAADGQAQPRAAWLSSVEFLEDALQVAEAEVRGSRSATSTVTESPTPGERRSRSERSPARAEGAFSIRVDEGPARAGSASTGTSGRYPPEGPSSRGDRRVGECSLSKAEPSTSSRGCASLRKGSHARLPGRVVSMRLLTRRERRSASSRMFSTSEPAAPSNPPLRRTSDAEPMIAASGVFRSCETALSRELRMRRAPSRLRTGSGAPSSWLRSASSARAIWLVNASNSRSRSGSSRLSGRRGSIRSTPTGPEEPSSGAHNAVDTGSVSVPRPACRTCARRPRSRPRRLLLQGAAARRPDQARADSRPSSPGTSAATSASKTSERWRVPACNVGSTPRVPASRWLRSRRVSARCSARRADLGLAAQADTSEPWC